MARSTTEVLAELLSISPTGWAWSGLGDPDGNYAGLLTPTAALISGLEQSAEAFGVQIDPRQATTLLDAWESVLDLPDPCAGADPTLPARQAQAYARLTDQGGCTASYFVAFAAALGFEITVSTLTPFRFGSSCFGQPMWGADAAFTWIVEAVSGRTDYAVLECELASRAPAQTTVLYGWNRTTQGVWDQFTWDNGVWA